MLLAKTSVVSRLPSKRVHRGGVVGGKVNADNDHKHKHHIMKQRAMSVEHKRCVHEDV